MIKDKIILKFEAEWCNPCKTLSKIMSDIEHKLDGIEIRKIDIDDGSNSDLVEIHSIRSIPTLVFIDNGKIFDSITGLPNRNDLIEKLQKFKNA